MSRPFSGAQSITMPTSDSLTGDFLLQAYRNRADVWTSGGAHTLRYRATVRRIIALPTAASWPRIRKRVPHGGNCYLSLMARRNPHGGRPNCFWRCPGSYLVNGRGSNGHELVPSTAAQCCWHLLKATEYVNCNFEIHLGQASPLEQPSLTPLRQRQYRRFIRATANVWA